MGNLSYDVAHLLGTSVLVLSFALLFQRRILGVLNIFALQATVLAAAAAWQAFTQAAPHLYITALIALLFKAITRAPFFRHSASRTSVPGLLIKPS